MKPIEKLKGLIIEGEFRLPQTKQELVMVIDQVVFLSGCDHDMDETIAMMKDLFIERYESKRGANEWCYISRIREALSKREFKPVNDIHKFLFGHDAIHQVIRELTAEGKILVEGKKVYLIESN